MVPFDAVVLGSDCFADGVLDIEEKRTAYSVSFADTDELALEFYCLK